MPFIYVIGGQDALYKIGHTKHTGKRVAALQTGSPRPLKVLAQAETETPVEHERSIHSALADKRMSGEWFACDLIEAISALRDCGLEPELTIADLPDGWLSSGGFQSWVAEMAKAPFYANDAECARLLGISANSVVAMKKNGCDRRTALACRALLHRLEPYGA